MRRKIQPLEPPAAERAAAALRQAVQLIGASRLATECGLDASNVSAWLRNNRVPGEYCRLIEVLTGRVVRAEDLRPDIFNLPARAPLVTREQVKQLAA